MRKLDRRSLLGLTTTTGITALAGCSALSDAGVGDGGDGGGDEDETDEDDDSTSGSTAGVEYESWIPVPSDGHDYFVYSADVDAMVEADAPTEAMERVGRLFFPIPEDVLAIDDVGEFASVARGAAVCTYDVDSETLRGRLEEMDDGEPATTGTQRAESDVPEGYEAFSANRMAYWLGEEHLLAARTSSFLRRMYETNQGEADAYADQELMGSLSERLSSGSIVAASPESPREFENDTGIGYAWSFDSSVSSGTRTNLKVVISFTDAEAASDADLLSLTEQRPIAEYSQFETTTDGRFAVLTGSVPMQEFDLFARDETETSTAEVRVPQVSLAFDYDRGSDAEWDGGRDERVVVTHDGGESIDTETISMRYEGLDVADDSRIESNPPGAEWTAGGRWVLQNDTTRTVFESGLQLTVIWRSPDGNSAQVLAESTIP